MAMTYFKRFDMEFDLSRPFPEPRLPVGYEWIAWSPEWLETHAATKFRSFRTEIDASVFPCLGSSDGCMRLMNDITRKDGFLPQATWLVAYRGNDPELPEFCGTIQGIGDTQGTGSVQNLGVVPEHRNLGLGRQLLFQAMVGFRIAGMKRAFLQVTARNAGALKLYRQLGFECTRTLYKVVETVYA